MFRSLLSASLPSPPQGTPVISLTHDDSLLDQWEWLPLFICITTRNLTLKFPGSSVPWVPFFTPQGNPVAQIQI